MNRRRRAVKRFIQQNRMLRIGRNCMRVLHWLRFEISEETFESATKSATERIVHNMHESGLLRRVVSVELLREPQQVDGNIEAPEEV